MVFALNALCSALSNIPVKFVVATEFAVLAVSALTILSSFNALKFSRISADTNGPFVLGFVPS
jgi:hypothetical protein